MIEPEPTDAELLFAPSGSDLAAYSVLYRRHAPTVLRFGWSRLDNRDAAEEVLQETFVTAWEKRASATIVDASALPWLLAISHNHVRNLARRRARDRAAPMADEVAASTDRADELAWIQDALARLTPDERRICELCLVEGFSYRDAARLIEITPAAAGKRLQRARARLRALLGDD